METTIKWLTKQIIEMKTCNKKMKKLLGELAAAAFAAAAVLPEK